MVVKKLIGKLVVALIRALIRAFFGMLAGIVFIGFLLIMLLFFGVLQPNASNVEIFSLLFMGAGMGAIFGFFDMLDFKRISHQQRQGKNIGNGSNNNSNQGQR